ncbi:50S ribosomal protein L9 [Ferrovibrio sp.]|uniref:50S ribosomal protein L9 n=1 Tax=Ferrovibrio sp. TaxID=1917215 RepID=UPI001B5F8A83|nr:50S ribosomal protein L9 [Ferrovibrio sp.]
MDVILLQRVEKLGQMGDVVKVKDGFARNFLLPRKKALRATNANKALFDKQRAQLEAQNLQQRQEAEKVAQKMAGLSVTILRQAGDSGQLYGSVSARDIADAATEAGFTIGRSQVNLVLPIKTIGISEVQVSLHPEVSLAVKVNVARSASEAEAQAGTGEAYFEAPEAEEVAEEDEETEE